MSRLPESPSTVESLVWRTVDRAIPLAIVLLLAASVALWAFTIALVWQGRIPVCSSIEDLLSGCHFAKGSFIEVIPSSEATKKPCLHQSGAS
jgi:hypothetical protein